jgi:hypothetical protein
LRLGHQTRALTVVYSFHILLSNDQETPHNLNILPKMSAEIEEVFIWFHLTRLLVAPTIQHEMVR